MRDFAEATFPVVTKPEAGGERFIISTEPFEWQQWSKYHHTRDKLLIANVILTVKIVRRLLGKPGAGEPAKADVAYDVVFDAKKKSREVLGLLYRDKEETARFILDDFKEKGWC